MDAAARRKEFTLPAAVREEVLLADGTALWQLKRYPEAKKILDSLLTGMPNEGDFARALALQAAIDINTGEKPAVIDRAVAALLDPVWGDIYTVHDYVFGLLDTVDDRRPLAQALDRYIKAHPGHPNLAIYRGFLAETWYKLNDDAAALSLAQQVLADAPEMLWTARVVLLIANAQERLGKPADSKPLLEAATRQYPNDGDLRAALLSRYNAEKNPDDLLAYAIKITTGGNPTPDALQVLFDHGKAAADAKDYPTALKLLGIINENAPEHPLARKARALIKEIKQKQREQDAAGKP